MTSTIPRPLLAIALALGMLTAVSAPSHAALSTADRSAPAAAAASTEALAVAAAPAATVTDVAPASVAKAAAPVASTAAPVYAHKVAARPQPRRIASASREAFASAIVPRGFGGRRGYPCH